MTQRMAPFVAVLDGIGKRSDADSIENDEEDAHQRERAAAIA